MAAFTGTDLKSTTLENAVLEAAMKLQIAEADSARNTSGRNAAQVTIDSDRKMATIQITMPIVATTDGTTGAISFVAETYLS